MPWKQLFAMRGILALAFLALPLSACETSSAIPNLETTEVKTHIVIPSDLRKCVGRLVPVPDTLEFNDLAVAELIGKLRESEVEKSFCGRRLIQLIEDYNAYVDQT